MLDYNFFISFIPSIIISIIIFNFYYHLHQIDFFTIFYSKELERIEILLRGSATDDNENEEGISYFIRDVIFVMILPLMKIVIHVCDKIIIYSCYNDDFDFYLMMAVFKVMIMILIIIAVTVK